MKKMVSNTSRNLLSICFLLYSPERFISNKFKQRIKIKPLGLVVMLLYTNQGDPGTISSPSANFYLIFYEGLFHDMYRWGVSCFSILFPCSLLCVLGGSPTIVSLFIYGRYKNCLHYKALAFKSLGTAEACSQNGGK